MEMKNKHQKNMKNSKKNEGLKIRVSTGDIIVLGSTIIAAAIGAAFVAHRGRSSGNNNKGRERRKTDEERGLQSLIHLGKEESSMDSLMENKGKERLSIEFQGKEESEKREDGSEGSGDSSIESSNETAWPAEVIEQEKQILTDLNEMKNQQGEGDESLGMGIQSVLPCKTNNDHGDEQFAFGNSVEIPEINYIATVENPLEVNTSVGDFSSRSNKQNTPQGQTEQHIEESDIAIVTKNELLDEDEVEKKEISETNEIKQQWEIPENTGHVFASECENNTGLQDKIEQEKMDDSMSTNEMNDQLDIPRKVEVMNGSADGYTNYCNNPVQESLSNGVEFTTLDKEESENLEDLKIARIEVDLVEKEGEGEEGDHNAHIEVVENGAGDGIVRLNVEIRGGDDITNIAVEAIEKDENGGEFISIEVENEGRGDDITHIEVEEEQQRQKGDGITHTKAVLEDEVGGEEDITHTVVEVVKEEVKVGKEEKEEIQIEGIAHIEVVEIVEEVEQKGGDDNVYTEAKVRAEEAEEEKRDLVAHIEMKVENEDDNVHEEVEAVEEVKADQKGDGITHIGLKEKKEEKKDGEQERSSLKTPEKEIKSPVEEENEMQESIRIENTSMKFNGKEVCTAEEVELKNYMETMYEMKQDLETPTKINQMVGIASAEGDENTNGGIQSFLPYNDKNMEVSVDISLAIQEKYHINSDIETKIQQTCKNFEMTMETGECMSEANIDHGCNVMKECSYSDGISNFSQDENKQDLQEPDISHAVEDQSPSEGDDITEVEAIEKDEHGGDGTAIKVENGERGDDVAHIEVEEEQQQQEGDGIAHTKAVLEDEVGGGGEDITHIKVEEGKEEKEEVQGEGTAHIEVKGVKVVEAKQERGEDANAHVEVVEEVEVVEVEQKGGDDIVYTEAKVTIDEAEEEGKGDSVARIEMEEEKGDNNVQKEVDAVEEEVTSDEKQGDGITHIEVRKEEEEKGDGEQESSSLKSAEKEIKSPVEEENETQESIRTENTSTEFNGKEVCTAEEVELENLSEPMYEMKQNLESPENINQMVGKASAGGDENTKGGIQSFLRYNDKNIEVPVDISLAIQEKDHTNSYMETESQQPCKNFVVAMETDESMSVANIDHGNNVMKERLYSHGISNFSQDDNKRDLQEPDISHVVEEDQSPTEGDDTNKVEAIDKNENGGEGTVIKVENGARGDDIAHIEVDEEQQRQKGDGITHTKAVLEDGAGGGGGEDITHIEVEVVKVVGEGKEEKEENQGEGIAHVEVREVKVVEAKEERGEDANAHVEVVEEVKVAEVEQKGGDDIVYTEAIVRAEESEEEKEKGDRVAHREMEEEKGDDNVHKEVDAVEEVKADEKEGDDITHIEVLKEEEEERREAGEQQSSSLKSPEKEIKSPVEEQNEMQESIRRENTSMDFNGKEVCTSEEVELENHLERMYEMKQNVKTQEKINQMVGIASAEGGENTNGGIQSFLPCNDKNIDVPVDISLAIQGKERINSDMETESQQTCKNFEMAMETYDSISVTDIDHGNTVIKKCSYSNGIYNFSQDENKQDLQEPDISHVKEEEDQSPAETETELCTQKDGESAMDESEETRISSMMTTAETISQTKVVEEEERLPLIENEMKLQSEIPKKTTDIVNVTQVAHTEEEHEQKANKESEIIVTSKEKKMDFILTGHSKGLFFFVLGLALALGLLVLVQHDQLRSYNHHLPKFIARCISYFFHPIMEL